MLRDTTTFPARKGKKMALWVPTFSGFSAKDGRTSHREYLWKVRVSGGKNRKEKKETNKPPVYRPEEEWSQVTITFL